MENPRKLILEPQSRLDMGAYTIAPAGCKIYEVKSGCLSSFFYMNPDATGGFNGDLYDPDGNVLSSLQSFIRLPHEMVSYDHIKVGDGYPKDQKKEYINELLIAAEITLGHEGFKKMITSTHGSMAHILNKYHGWKYSGERGGLFDMEREL